MTPPSNDKVCLKPTSRWSTSCLMQPTYELFLSPFSSWATKPVARYGLARSSDNSLTDCLSLPPSVGESAISGLPALFLLFLIFTLRTHPVTDNCNLQLSTAYEPGPCNLIVKSDDTLKIQVLPRLFYREYDERIQYVNLGRLITFLFTTQNLHQIFPLSTLPLRSITPAPTSINSAQLDIDSELGYYETPDVFIPNRYSYLRYS